MSFTQIPFDKVVKFGQKTMLDCPLFAVSWILGRFCNYNCSYCWPYARSNQVDHFPLAVYLNAIDSIKHQAYKNKFTQFHWSFSGGEPTAYRDLLKLISRLADVQTKYQSLHMTTNLSPGEQFWTNWLASTDFLDRRSLTASFIQNLQMKKNLEIKS